MNDGVQLVGLGAVSPAGAGVQSFWQALYGAPAAPRSDAVQGLPVDGRSLRHGYALPASVAAAGSRFHAVAVQAAEEALQDAQQRGVALDGLRLGLALGTGAGDAELGEQRRWAREPAGFGEVNPYAVTATLADHLSWPVEGPCFAVANACSAGLYALAHAADLVRTGMADAMLVIGVELLSRVTQAGFQRMTALDAQRCRPFDAHRCGTVLGEGAAALLIVSAEVKARAYARLAGTGVSCDAYHPTAPQPQGRDIATAVRQALRQAGSPEFVDLVVPHGTGTPLNDRIESEMLAAVLGAAVADAVVLPIKSHIGHGAGASGSFSVVAAALALSTREVPPVRHIETPDARLPVHLRTQVTRWPTGRPLRALVNAYGFGGNNVSLVLSREAA